MKKLKTIIDDGKKYFQETSYDEFLEAEEEEIAHTYFYSDYGASHGALKAEWKKEINELKADKDYNALIKKTVQIYLGNFNFGHLREDSLAAFETIQKFFNEYPSLLKEVELIHIYDNQLNTIEISFYCSANGDPIVEKTYFSIAAKCLNNDKRIPLLNRMDYLLNIKEIESHELHESRDLNYISDLAFLAKQLFFQKLCFSLKQSLSNSSKLSSLAYAKWVVSEYDDELFEV
jgi:hypothetical protein